MNRVKRIAERRCDSRSESRGQASVTIIETAVAVVLLTAIILSFAIGLPDSGDGDVDAQLDVIADDATTILASEPPRHANQTRLAEVTAIMADTESDRAQQDRAEFERRVDRILPDNVMYRLETADGTLGYPLPDDVTTGSATVLTPNGEVTLRVWYA